MQSHLEAKRRDGGKRVKCWGPFLLLAATTLLCVEPGWGQISPGPLSKAHQSVSGTTQCVSCHKLGADREFRCLECHTEIARRLDENRGFHAGVVAAGEREKACATCHAEHKGENVSLIHWEPSREAFDHRKTGYALEGKHATLDCARCHTAAHIAEAERKFIVVKDLSKTFLGLSRNCLSCHRDAHNGQLGRDCARCHSFSDWKASATFDHSKARFPLTGQHAQVACQKCHLPTGKPGEPPRFTGLPFGQCNDCHTDPHRGAFAGTCDSCHSTAGWKAVSLAGKFDHAKTDFPLAGKHTQVQCTDCHRRADFKTKVAHQRCADCHRPDPHGGQFSARADGGECAACHTVEGFKPARFGVSEHRQTKYPLEGKHATIACEKCHLPAGKATRYRLPFAHCTDCHADAHKGQFAGPPRNNRCEGCHTVHGFRPSTFTLAQHQESRFPLTGGHPAIACVECHHLPAPARPNEMVRFHMDDHTCTACHTTPHRDQFRERMARKRPDGSVAGCEACHSTKAWRELASFDHATTSFPLLGAHRAVACIDCHRPPNLEVSMKNVTFQSAGKDCDSCHADPHARQFAKAGKVPRCAECHNPTRWKPSLFDHDKLTSFLLQGGHAGLRCSQCHNTFREIDGKRVLFYMPTPKQCAACHAG